jgi:capsular exopolysaccharide synthesis family protein
MAESSRGYGRERARGNADTQSLLRYYRVLRERVWLILGCTVLALAAAGAYVKLAPRTYTAQAEMEVQAASPSAAVLSSLPILHQTGDPTEDVLTGASLVTTPRVATAVVRVLRLSISPGAALAAVTSSPVGQASLVAVQANSSSPQLAQHLANAFVQQTIALSTAEMHASISAELPTLVSTDPTTRATVAELQLLLHQNDPTLRQIAAASLPTGPSSPKTKLTLVAGLFGGLLLGVGAALAFHAFDPRLRRESQLRDLLGLPILAQVPLERYRRRPWPLLPSELSVSSNEGYRTLRTALAAKGPSGQARSYLVTGSAPSEGKTTTAISLAVALAQGGGRVILIEADVRKPTFAATFGLKDFAGIEQVLIGEAELSQALVPVRAEGTSMRVLAAERSGVELANRLSYAVTRKLLDDAKAISDFVVIDSPPLTEVIDALPFAQLADEVLIVARLDRSRLNKLAELDALLTEYGAATSGLLLVGGPHRPQYYGVAGNGADPDSRASRRRPAPRGDRSERPQREPSPPRGGSPRA